MRRVCVCVCVGGGGRGGTGLGLPIFTPCRRKVAIRIAACWVLVTEGAAGFISSFFL